MSQDTTDTKKDQNAMDEEKQELDRPSIRTSITSASLNDEKVKQKKLRWEQEPPADAQFQIPSFAKSRGRRALSPSSSVFSQDEGMEASQSDLISIYTDDLMDKWDTGNQGTDVIVPPLEEPTPPTLEKKLPSDTNFTNVEPLSGLDIEMKGFYNRPSIVNVIKDEKSKSALNEMLETPLPPRASFSFDTPRRMSVIRSIEGIRTSDTSKSGRNVNESKRRASSQLQKELVAGTLKNHQPEVASPKRFGILEGVIIPCISSVLGTILFLRVPWIIAQAGLAFSLLYLFISVLCSVLTWFSLSAIVTNGYIPTSGGPYVILSRVLGPQFGGSVGLIYYLGFVLLISLHSFGAADLLLTTIRLFYPEFIMADTDRMIPYWDIIIFAIGFIILVFVFAFFGIRLAAKLELIILVITFLTILLFIIGCFTTHNAEYAIDGASVQHFFDNFPPDFQHGQDFFTVMAIIFPSVVGILAGMNRSGNLKHLSRDIPRGTIFALLTTTFIYVLIFILISFVGSRQVMIENTTYFSLVAFPDYGLAIGTYIAKAGILLSILGESLQALVAGPRILSAISSDNIMPFFPLHYFSTNTSEPRKAVLFSACLAVLPLFLGNLERISTFIAMFLLLCFGFVNIATVIATFSPNWRPRWRFYHWSVGLFGFILCAVCMFLIGWYWAVLAFALGLLFYAMIEYRSETSSYGDALKGVKLQSALNALYYYESAVHTHRSSNWRPQLLCLVKILPNNTLSHSEILNLAHQLKKGGGLCIVSAIIEGDVKKKYPKAKKEKIALRNKMKEKGIIGFAQVVISRSYREGVQHLIQSTGLGGLQPNTVVTGFPKKDANSARNFVDLIMLAEIFKKAVIISKGDFNVECNTGYIDLYWIIYEGGLELLISNILHKHKAWKDTAFRIFTVVDDQDIMDEVKENIMDILYHLRIEAECHVIYLEHQDVTPFEFKTKSESTKPKKKESLFRDVRSLSMQALNEFVNNDRDPIEISIENEMQSHPTQDDTEHEEPTSTRRESTVSNAAEEYNRTSHRINKLIREHLNDSQLVIINLPSPSSHLSHIEYVECLEILTNGIERLLLIRGSGKEVITHLL